MWRKSKLEHLVEILLYCSQESLIASHIAYRAFREPTEVVEDIGRLVSAGYLEVIYDEEQHRRMYKTTEKGIQLLNAKLMDLPEAKKKLYEEIKMRGRGGIPRLGWDSKTPGASS